MRKFTIIRADMKYQRKAGFSEESIEAKRHAASEASSEPEDLRSLWKDLFVDPAKDTAKGIGSQMEILFGIQSAELKEGQEVDLKKSEKPQVAEAHMEYFREVKNADVISENREGHQINQQIEKLRIELKKLTSASKLVERAVKDAAAEQAPVKAGKYHLRFFEFVISVVKDATRKLEDAASFGALFTSKKRQRQYWNMYKKHGTTFGLSGERTTATQTG